MRRSAKIGLYATVLVGIIGGTTAGAWAMSDKSVTVSVDGQARTIHTRSATVGGALKSAHLHLTAHDVVAPATSAGIHDGTSVIVRRGRELNLKVDGRSQLVWTTAPTVDTALAELGYGTGKTVSVSRAKRLPLTPTQITLLSTKHVTIVAGDKRVALITTTSTVAGAVAASHISVGTNDVVSAPMASPTTNGQTITIKHVLYLTKTTDISVPFATTTKNDKLRLLGTTMIVQNGRAGLTRQQFQFVYVDGKLVGRRLVATVVVRKPVAQITKIGTKIVKAKKKSKPEVTPIVIKTKKSDDSGSGSKKSDSSKKSDDGPSKKSTAKSGSGSSSKKSGGSTGSVSGSPKQIARALLAQRGWGDSQMSCLVKLWNRESGWSTHAANSSGAYGIPQSLPGSKMASAGPDWRNNAETQIKWGLHYISGRYGSPCGAWAHSQSHNWY